MRAPVLVAIAGLACAFATAARSAPTASAGRPAPYRLEHGLTLDTFSDLAWSADGERLAFVVTAVDTAENTTNADLWLWESSTGKSRPLTRHPKADFSPTFSPSGDTIAFIANRATGDEPKPTIYFMSLRGGDPWPFGTFDESIGEVSWSPDGRHLAFVKSDTLPKSVREARKKKWDAVVEDQILQLPHLWVIDVATGKQRRLTFGQQHVWYVRWSPDSRSLAFLTRPTGKPDDTQLTDVGIVSVDGGAQRTLGLVGAAFAWSPDGRWIALASNGADRDLHVAPTDLYVAPAAGGRAINLTAGYDEEAETPAWSRAGDSLYFHTPVGLTTRLAVVPRAGGRVSLTASERGVAGAPTAASTGRVAWVQSSPAAPSEVFVADHVALRGRAGTDLNADVARLALAPERSFTWTSTDGVRAEGLLVRPAGAGDRTALKTVVLLHGGPYGSRTSFNFNPIAQFLAARGYQVFAPNFRSSDGYGTSFLVRQRSDWGGQDWRDVQSGIDSLIARGLADPKRLAVYGHSYGGYLSAWALTQTDRFDAVVVSAGAVDLASLYGQSDVQKYRAFEFEGYPWATGEKWAKSSPFTYLRNAKTPTLILNGDDDRRIPLAQALELYRALLALEVPVELVRYPREGHTMREYRHRNDYFTRLAAWLDRWVK